MIVLLSSVDYSNLSFSWAESLRSIGVDCKDLTLQKHSLYSKQSQVASIGRMIATCRDAEVIIVMHSSDQIYDQIKDLGKRVVVAHTGTRYRENHIVLNQKFKGCITLSDQCEFMHLGDHKYITAPIELQPAPLYNGLLKKIAHYPSNAFVKGTDKIIEMLKQFRGRFKWNYSHNLVSHDAQLRRMADCDIYIELFKPELRGKPYGCFGVTALEAAMMGKICLTNNIYPKVYEDAYGKSPFTVVNTEQEFINTINVLLSMDQSTFKNIQKETIEITKENHNFVATGNRLMRLIYE